jgi:hypothetical protein
MSERKVEYVDITPSWSDLVGPLVFLAIDGETPSAKRHAWDELKKMAALADLYVELQGR